MVIISKSLSDFGVAFTSITLADRIETKLRGNSSLQAVAYCDRLRKNNYPSVELLKELKQDISHNRSQVLRLIGEDLVNELEKLHL